MLEKNVSKYKQVWLAVLGQAIKDIQGRPGLCRGYNYTDAVRDEALIWVFSDEYEFGSFLWVCDVCGVNPWFVRGLVGDGQLKTRKEVNYGTSIQ